tara:strand:+ start:432 stop:737 length:306 start_codon:yes stop_codon:yes gene_type:complete
MKNTKKITNSDIHPLCCHEYADYKRSELLGSHIYDIIYSKVLTQIVYKYELDFNPIIEGEAEEYFNNNNQYLLDTVSNEEYYTLELFIKIINDATNKKLEY